MEHGSPAEQREGVGYAPPREPSPDGLWWRFLRQGAVVIKQGLVHTSSAVAGRGQHDVHRGVRLCNEVVRGCQVFTRIQYAVERPPSALFETLHGLLARYRWYPHCFIDN